MAIERFTYVELQPNPLTERLEKQPLGATESVDWEYQEKNVLDVLIKYQKLDYNLIAVEQTSKAISFR